MTNYLIIVVLFVASLIWSLLLIYVVYTAWINYKQSFEAEADARLSEMFLFFDPKHLFFLNISLLFIGPLVIYISTGSLFQTIAAVIIIALLPKKLYTFLYKKRVSEFELALPDALSQISGSIRAGGTMPNAVEQFVAETKGPISKDSALMLKSYRVGVSIDQALEEMNDRVPNESLRMVVSAANIAREVGGNLAEIFERLGETLRLKQSMELKINALTAQGKMQGWVVGLLPVGMILVLYKLEPEVMSYLSTGLLGWAFLATIIVLEIIGFIMIKKIVAIDI